MASKAVGLSVALPLWYSPAGEAIKILWPKPQGRDFMRRMIDATKRAVMRVGARTMLVGLAVTGATGGGWWGWQYVKSAPQGPTKQIATGVDRAAPKKSGVQPAMASLSDDQLPTASAEGNVRQMQYSQ